MKNIGRIGALLQKGTKIVPQRALFYGPSNGALRATFQYRLFFSVCTKHMQSEYHKIGRQHDANENRSKELVF